MLEAINTIKFWYQLYYADGVFLVMAIVSYLYLFAHCKDTRKKFLYPIALIIFCVINPVLYKFVFSGIIYWRLFWMVPDAIIIAAAITGFVKNCKKNWEKLLILGALVIVILIKGTNVFLHGNFTKVQNWEKVPPEVVAVCDVILEKDDDPNAVFPRQLYSDVRQYAPEISLIYGRNAEGYIDTCDMDELEVYWRMEKEAPDFDFIFNRAEEKEYEFIVVEEQKVVGTDVLEKYGFAELARTSGYVIYYNTVLEL